MFPIGKLGNYVSQGVSAVVRPFQGAVDIIVVQQDDGSFRSSPWYVRWYDPQGSRREKGVDIWVNDVKASFSMVLNSKGEALFEKEEDASPRALTNTATNSSVEDSNGVQRSMETLALGEASLLQHNGENVRLAQGVLLQDTQRMPILQGESLLLENDSVIRRTQAIDTKLFPAERSAKSLETSVTFPNVNHKESASESRVSMLISSHQESYLSGVMEQDIQMEEITESCSESFCGLLIEDGKADELIEASPYVRLLEEAVEIVDDSSNFAVTNEMDVNMVHEAQLVSNIQPSDTVEDDAMLHTIITEDWFALQEISTVDMDRDFLAVSDTTITNEYLWNEYKIVNAEDENNRSLLDADQVGPYVSISDGLLDGNIALENNKCLTKHTKDSCTVSICSEKDAIFKVEEVVSMQGNGDISVPVVAVPPSSRWWPLSFKKSAVTKISSLKSGFYKNETSTVSQVPVGNPLSKETLKNDVHQKLSPKRKVLSYLPTSDQISSLKLKEGPNKVTFTFPSARRKAQVDASIYLWKWNTRIVVSDVDGTITKSDVLGQVMPFVGKDWSHSGVTRLFSAIKENGYELLFLSARAISQSYLTRQFLGNLRQDGATLPEGPVFISPDGLLPSLYREVIRRTPHEFKISCLEEVKKLFPRHVNPFYAGFGNRVTDEISYRRVGIPRGKIFMINPKGEVMVNNHVHVKTYTTIHALVDGMFPPVCSSEQEDFNSWNFWKLPIPNLIDEINEKSSKKRRDQNSKK